MHVECYEGHVQGETLSHYRIVEQIGAGGMGIVYRAHDEHLDRDVAIKVLPARALSNHDSRSKFRREALTLARLDHPNIATIFEFATEGSIDFLVTSYIPGITLDSMLANRRLSAAQVLDLGVQLANGLTAAHGRGVIHRDLKPGNLRLTPSGLLKILDFGLASFFHSEAEVTSSRLTQSQEFAGTLPYMAPEQLRGDKVDTRCDIWAAGAVLYEMATGKRPFPQVHTPALVSGILNSSPKSPRDLNPEIPRELENVILKALNKDPARRYQTAVELELDLKRVQQGRRPLGPRRLNNAWLYFGAFVLILIAAAIGAYVLQSPESKRNRRSVAVLGFKNLSGAPDRAWVSTALAEMLTTELGAGGKLRTIPGETVARVKADLALPDSESLGKESLSRIYESIGSNLVVLGSYLHVNGVIRVDLRVQDTSAGQTIATTSETGTENQFFDLVKRVGESLRSQCGAGRPSAEELAATRASEPVSAEAAKYYAEGLAKLRTFDALTARDLFQQAVQTDPRNAIAYSALGAAWSQLGYDDKAMRESKAAFELAGTLSQKDKLSIEAQYRENTHDWERAVEIYQSLWTFFPDDLEYGLHLAGAQVSAGKGADSLTTVDRLRRLSLPSREDVRIDLAEGSAADSISDYRRQQSAAKRALAKARKLGLRLLTAQALLQQCWSSRNLGEFSEAIRSGEEAKAILEAAGDSRAQAQALTCMGSVVADQGQLNTARDMREQALLLANKVGAQKDIAGALINLGNISVAQGDLEKSTEQYRNALSVSQNIGDKPDALLAQNNIAANLILACDFGSAEKMSAGALRTASEIGDQAGYVTALTNLALIHFRLGNLSASKKALAESLIKARELGWKSAIAAILNTTAEVALAEGDLAGSEQAARESLKTESEIGEQGGVASVNILLALLNIEKGNFVVAGQLGQSAAEEFEKENNGDQEASARTVIAESLAAQDKLTQAAAELDHTKELAIHDQYVLIGRDIQSAHLWARSKRAAESLRQLEKIQKRARDLGVPGHELRARLEQAQAEFLAGDVRAARANAVSAQHDAERIGYKLIARKAAAFVTSIDRTKNLATP
jgi:serine/threonine protein kinase/Tfp pilus assembly protein PilF